MFSQIRPAIVAFTIFTVITGVLYPALVTAIAKIGFSHEAEGSLIDKGGKTVGSELIGQGFTQPKYFWPRPSAAAYSGTGASGSNIGPSNSALVDAAKQRMTALQAADPHNDRPVPIELVTTSASGLDPHLSPAAMAYQTTRVAAARGVGVDAVTAIVQKYTTPRLFGVIGEPTVNVMLVNLELDQMGKASAAAATQPNTRPRLGYRALGFLPESK